MTEVVVLLRYDIYVVFARVQVSSTIAELARMVSVPNDQRLGSQLITTLMAIMNVRIYHFFSIFLSPSQRFLLEGGVESKNLC